MINWKALDPAIYPSQPFDIYGCWSGSATILPGDKPVIVYTGIDPQKRQIQNIAFPSNLSDPYLREWTKPDHNPVIDPSDSAVNASAFRDPTTAWYTPHDQHWSLVIGTRRGSRGVAVLDKSKDFVKWTKAPTAALGQGHRDVGVPGRVPGGLGGEPRVGHRRSGCWGQARL
ncbi:unnamed protein product [Musa acuminata subsp. malaccensis]|uniref:(wild Malaysian banana) hypothetical protein n=1 Tax=Musa acuminata subsp. malaccensis TaxID=214687 RepID=A0A8D7AE48_MUSAM|nr:unnamed protein product [Musa acuminata subsp. malaccensis]